MSEPRLFSSGGLARELGASLSTIRRLDESGVLPKATRVEGSEARVFMIGNVDELASIRERIAANRREKNMKEPISA